MEYQPAGRSRKNSHSDSSAVVERSEPDSASRRRVASLRGGPPAVIPSLLLCDFGHLADEVHRLEAAGVRGLHLDVMDGQFVPNISYGLPIVEAVRRVTELPIEAHLMIAEPVRYAEQFFSAGADIITIHVEATDEPRVLLEKLRSQGAATGLAYNPTTPLSAIQDCLDVCDLILTMSVSPGFGGQKFQAVALDKLRLLAGQVGPEVLLEVDGGVNAETIGACAAAGARLLVAGSAIFNHPDYSQSVAKLTHLAETNSRTH
jgi:ribulose-phosphate 3-epimerase